MEGFIDIQLFSSVDQEDFVRVLVKSLCQFVIEEITNGSSGLHQKVSQRFRTLQPLDVDVQPFPIHPVQVHHMHDVLLVQGNSLLPSYLLSLQEHHNLLWLDPESTRDHLPQLIV